MKTPARKRASHHGRNRRDQSAPRRQEKDKATGRENRPARKETFRLKSTDNIVLYGRNPVEAALRNPKRQPVRLLATPKGAQAVPPQHCFPHLATETITSPEPLLGFIPDGALHQGIFLETRPLEGSTLDDLTPIEAQKNIILMLDQVTDPQNVGACLRSAAAFGARAVITQDRNSPNESGALARASAGGIEIVPWVRAANLSQTLETLKEMGYWHIGLDGSTDKALKNVNLGGNLVLVMGSEGKGLRPLVRKHCDMIAKIPITEAVESLNVSNAAAIALYQMLQI